LLTFAIELKPISNMSDTPTTSRVIEVTDTEVKTSGGRKMIRRVEKILMPNGGYRYPVTYIDLTPGFRRITDEELNNGRVPDFLVVI
jgi:hypothetical protein